MGIEKNIDTGQVAFAGSAIAAAVAAVIFAATTCVTASVGADQAQAETPAQEAHVHTWQKDMEIVHHDAVTHTENHAATYADAAVPHTICNTCGLAIDGQTKEHRDRTGHAEYTPDVPVLEQQKTADAWTDIVIDEAAYDELVALTETCMECGETRSLAADDAEAQDA